MDEWKARLKARNSARQRCPALELLAQTSVKSCMLGTTFGCGACANCSTSTSQIWTATGCHGVFRVSGQVTVCGSVGKANSTCQAGDLRAPAEMCGMMLLTTFFTKKVDWQRGSFAEVSFRKIKLLYQSSLQLGLNVTVVYDQLPKEFISVYECDQFRFQRVNMADVDPHLGVNDVRYLFFEQLVHEHTEWKSVFMLDAFDSRIIQNPCGMLQEDMLYVGREETSLATSSWMRERYADMGDKYDAWFRSIPRDRHVLNCGILGGRRPIVLRFLTRMVQALQDPSLAIRKVAGKEINVDMAAMNYVVYNHFGGKFTGGRPVHSTYKAFERYPRDVWFVHK